MKHRAWLKQMEIRFRSAMPQWFRQAYRIAKSAGAQRQSAELRADVMDDCRFVRDRYEILRLLPKGGTVAEIGTETGDFARQIVKLNQPAALHLVDINFSKFDADGLPQASVTRHEGLSAEILAVFPDASFDWIYIDADHSYEGVLRDARGAMRKVKPGGYMIFNDFGHIDPYLGRYGVHRAAVDFINESGWQMRYFAYNAAALYDVAIQRPK